MSFSVKLKNISFDLQYDQKKKRHQAENLYMDLFNSTRLNNSFFIYSNLHKRTRRHIVVVTIFVMVQFTIEFNILFN